MSLGSNWYGEQFVIAMGQAGQLSVPYCDRVFEALLAFLSRTDLLAVTDVRGEDDLNYFGPDQISKLRAKSGGIFVARCEPGKWIHRGEHVGSVYDDDSGEEIAELTSPVTGLITALRKTPRVSSGDLLAEVCQRYGD